MRASSRSSRGGGWVVAQFVLIALIVSALWLPPHVHSRTLHVLGVVAGAAGIALAAWAARTLGRSLTPFPRPLPDSMLATSGPYGLVRHPIYLGGLFFFVGLSLLFSWPALALSGVLAVLWGAKTRVEEAHLTARFPEYEEYRRRVRRRLVPFVY